MKITIEHYNERITIETKHDDITAHETVDILYRLCVMVGYSEKNVADAFADLGANYYEITQ
jgi:hypothetical protein